ncbi:PhnE/PtxC family ABC transporter permease [Companilactobacillus bobalius]|uniref:Phosphate-import permease protein PhnE n=2 Tax=Companilactobacillus bobalius TaxID=2801451 RepID=A0A202FE49_9LACO|nr:ABC transporter permease subunit [Companilactobacillus bobalius]KAE9557091.1 phosphonate ABC transporter permease [Companilactobacillus bobalius]KRK82017.1 phosphonate ABC transporter, inner membrane subunit [Companilactobacillus bobalius DSM 19674]OVE98754.1 Phosphate-import permease protein PhnE [Companilactobacillus bobalius]GEO57928.1 phosphonate ABC transporter, permease protein PhnE [Companilactobacillus paralimentarius]
MQSSAKYLTRKGWYQTAIIAIIGGTYILGSWILNFDNLSVLVAVPRAFGWLGVNFQPTAKSVEYLPKIWQKLMQTVLLAISSTVVAAIISIFVALIGSKVTGINGFVQLIVRGIASFFRNIPLVAWSMILLFSFKQSDFTGFLALLLMSIGFLIRAFMEIIEDEASETMLALKATGASYFQVIFQAVLPQILPSVLSWILYMIENNVRDATLVGILTGTGIGFIFDLYYKSFRFDAAGMTVLSIIIVVIGLELISNQIRKVIL